MTKFSQVELNVTVYGEFQYEDLAVMVCKINSILQPLKTEISVKASGFE
jgi:hypothetical protein